MTTLSAVSGRKANTPLGTPDDRARRLEIGRRIIDETTRKSRGRQAPAPASRPESSRRPHGFRSFAEEMAFREEMGCRCPEPVLDPEDLDPFDGALEIVLTETQVESLYPAPLPLPSHPIPIRAIHDFRHKSPRERSTIRLT